MAKILEQCDVIVCECVYVNVSEGECVCECVYECVCVCMCVGACTYVRFPFPASSLVTVRVLT